LYRTWREEDSPNNELTIPYHTYHAILNYSLFQPTLLISAPKEKVQTPKRPGTPKEKMQTPKSPGTPKEKAKIPTNPRQCAICTNEAVGVNYGVLSCKSCRFFFYANSEKTPELEVKFSMGLWQGVALGLFKFYPGPPCPTLLHPAGVFYPLTHPTLYAFAYDPQCSQNETCNLLDPEQTRRCRSCRMQKCRQEGMKRGGEDQDQQQQPPSQCAICCNEGKATFYGVFSCYTCKFFFQKVDAMMRQTLNG
jgi:hypothetical protein